MNRITKEQIIECEERLLKAMKSNDLKILDELLHDNLLFIIPSGDSITKDIDLGNWRSGNIVIHEIFIRDQVINLIGDNAVVSVIKEMKGQYLENAFEGRFRYFRVWKLVNNGWKVIGGSGIQLP